MQAVFVRRTPAAGRRCYARFAAAVCIPADSMLWALVTRIREEGYLASADDLRALIGSGCPRERVKEVLEREAPGHPAFRAALVSLEQVGTVAVRSRR